MNKVITVANKNRSIVIIKKSKFIASISPVNSTVEAEEFISQIRSEFMDATHNVYAYVVDGQQLQQKFSDDGEPSGTAGRPVLEVIKKNGLSNVAVVVTRYFGGIMLGAGGLVRAYTEAVKTGLEDAGRVTLASHIKVIIECSYEEQKNVRYVLGDTNAQIEDISYGERVSFTLYVLEDKMDIIRNLRNVDIAVSDICLRGI